MATAPGYHEGKDDVLRRLRRIEGQVRGLERLVEQDTYCIDVLTQVAATTKALQAVAVQLLQEHLKRCVADAATGRHAQGTPTAGVAAELDAATDRAASATATAGARTVDELVAEATKAIERLLRT